MNGEPCIRGTRLTVNRVVSAVATYPVREDLFRNYPGLEEEDIRQALEFVRASSAGSPDSADVGLENWYVREMEAGLQDLDAGNIVSHAEVSAVLRSWGKPSVVVERQND